MNKVRISILAMLLCAMMAAVVVAAIPTPVFAAGGQVGDSCAIIACPTCSPGKILVKSRSGVLALDPISGVVFCKASPVWRIIQGCGASCPK